MPPTNLNPTNPSLFTLLPEELYLPILDNLPIPSILALSQTSQQFNRIANPTSDSKRRSLLITFLIEAQAFSRWRGDGFACFVCCKILPRRNFVDGHTRNEWGWDGERQVERFCVLCGLETGRLEAGSEVWRGTSLLVVCRCCGLLKRGSRGCGMSKVCEDCDRDGGVC